MKRYSYTCRIKQDFHLKKTQKPFELFSFELKAGKLSEKQHIYSQSHILSHLFIHSLSFNSVVVFIKTEIETVGSNKLCNRDFYETADILSRVY